MDVMAVDLALQRIAKTRIELSKMDYNNPNYDDLEEQLHGLEDDFQDQHGEEMEEVLRDIHDEYCPDSDVLMPIAYLAKNYIMKDNQFSVTNSDGVFVDTDDYEGKETRLVILPNPVRVVLTIGQDAQETVWKGLTIS